MNRRRTPLPALVVLALLSALPAGAYRQLAAQADSPGDFIGVVLDAATGRGIENAIVEVEGHRAVLSGTGGRFRVGDVTLGQKTVSVSALGYHAVELSVPVETDQSVTIILEPSPIPLDSIVVSLSTTDLKGLVRDPDLDAIIHDARVSSDQGHREWTNWHGRFELDDVYEGVPIRITAGAFGYLPLDTMLIPTPQERHELDLAPDAFMRKMIAVQVDRLTERAQNGERYRPHRFYANLDREDMAPYMAGASLQILLERTIPMGVLRKVTCILIDEREVGYSREERIHFLQTTLPQELERIEFLEFPGQHGTLMMRIYSRRFMQELVATNRPLRTPVMVNFTRACL